MARTAVVYMISATLHTCTVWILLGWKRKSWWRIRLTTVLDLLSDAVSFAQLQTHDENPTGPRKQTAQPTESSSQMAGRLQLAFTGTKWGLCYIMRRDTILGFDCSLMMVLTEMRYWDMVKLKWLIFQIRVTHFIFWNNRGWHNYVQHFTPPSQKKTSRWVLQLHKGNYITAKLFSICVMLGHLGKPKLS
jgi:hypothetical protein